jgi:hypothetical protein
MEPLTLPLAVVGITQFVKLAVNELVGIEVKGAVTVVVAALVAVGITFVNLESELIQNIYAAVVAVGGLTAGVKIFSSLNNK